MKKDKILKEIQDYTYHLFEEDVTGHDFHHMRRVAGMAKHISKNEAADPFIAEAAAWLHDIGDRKLFSRPEESLEKLHDFLQSLHPDSTTIENIEAAFKDTSYHKGEIPKTKEGMIVQDADRLDAIGAVGIARTFAYGGANEQPIHGNGDRATSIQHFYDKLLHLQDTLHTGTAKEIALERHQFLLTFLKQFHREWQASE
ncbi:HD domain-containing protein [Virgibacillus xinjiangensis]|uniref:HD domain-containing protein n=1 Tax=Virgibacillus xinjiangensis TaxID=393090 RepID=A0ABV7CR57_9BACI